MEKEKKEKKIKYVFNENEDQFWVFFIKKSFDSH